MGEGISILDRNPDICLYFSIHAVQAGRFLAGFGCLPAGYIKAKTSESRAKPIRGDPGFKLP